MLASTTAHEIPDMGGFILRPKAHKHHEVPIPKLNVPAEVEDAMGKLARLVLNNKIAYSAATEAFQTKLVVTAIQDKNGIVEQAAKHLRMNVGWAWKIMRGLAFRGKSHK